jgi:hypothetical protein
MKDAPAPPRKPGRWSRRALGLATGRAFLGAALIALTLLVAAPERHLPCLLCSLATKGSFAGVVVGPQAGQVQVNGSAWVDVGWRDGEPFRALEDSGGALPCSCVRHPALAEWYDILTGAPTSALKRLTNAGTVLGIRGTGITFRRPNPPGAR